MKHKVQLSKIIAGTMTWGTWGRNCNTNEMVGLINSYIDNNITTFDHADIYGDYSTEAAFGDAFKVSKISRDKIQLISKCGIQLQNDSRNNFIKHYNYSASYIIESVNQSLKNLQTSYLDLLLLHRPSPLMNPNEIAEAIEQLKKEGKILDFGVSNFTPNQTDLIKKLTEVNFNQISFSVTDFDAMVNGSLDYMYQNNITPLSWSPLGNVFKNETNQSVRIKKIIANLSKKYNVEEDLILLAWILKHPANIIPVCGTTNVYRIKNLIKASEFELELQDWFLILTESAGKEVA